MMSRRGFGGAALVFAVLLASVSLAPHGADADAAKSVSSGDSFTCAVTEDGGVQCWGYGEVGQLGTGSTTAPEICENQFSDPYMICSKTPVDVVGLTSGEGCGSRNEPRLRDQGRRGEVLGEEPVRGAG